MKKFTLFLMMFAGFVSTTLASNVPVEPKQALQEKVDGLLSDYNNEISEDLDARIVITITEKNEILVVDVKTNDDEVEKYIKSALNYVHVEGVDTLENNMYTFNVEFKAAK